MNTSKTWIQTAIIVILTTACNSGGGAPVTNASNIQTSSIQAAPIIDPTNSPSPDPSPSPTTSPSPSPSPSPSSTPYSFAGGSGTLSNPYWLENATDIQNLGQYPNAYFTMKQDIDMSSISNFQPIASFSGTIYGNNYYLYNLKMTTTGANNAALFLTLSGTLVSLGLQNVTISSQAYAAGFASNVTGTVSSCNISGTITSSLGGNGFNTGTGNPIYTQNVGSVTNTTQSVMFNGNHVTNTL